MSNERDIVSYNYLIKRFGFSNIHEFFHDGFVELKVFDGSKYRIYRWFIDFFGYVNYIRIK